MLNTFERFALAMVGIAMVILIGIAGMGYAGYKFFKAMSTPAQTVAGGSTGMTNGPDLPDEMLF